MAHPSTCCKQHTGEKEERNRLIHRGARSEIATHHKTASVARHAYSYVVAPFHGIVEEAAVYDRALTPQEVALYHVATSDRLALLPPRRSQGAMPMWIADALAPINHLSVTDLAATRDDDKVLDDFFNEVAPLMEALVAKALQQGRAQATIALRLERSFDGNVSGGCGLRWTIADDVGSDARLPPSVRRVISALVRGAGEREIPAVLLVQSEGYLLVRMKMLSGSLVGVG